MRKTERIKPMEQNDPERTNQVAVILSWHDPFSENILLSLFIKQLMIKRFDQKLLERY